MYCYTHRVHYYETDKMGITHHSNYIRFMEEARVAWMDSIGYSFIRCEKLGLMSPILEVNCKYKHNTTFDDEIRIEVKLIKYDGLKTRFAYNMYVKDQLVCVAESEHCFVNMQGFPIRLKKDVPELDQILRNELEKDKEN